MAPGQRAQVVQVTGDRGCGTGLAARGLKNDSRDVATLEQRLDSLDVVRRTEQDLVEGRAGHASGERHLERGMDARHDPVVPAVEVSVELYDLGLSGEGARHA